MVVEKSRKYSVIISPAAYFVCSLIAVMATEGKVTAPLLCALAGAVFSVNSTAVCCGGILGYIACGTAFENGFIICSLLLVTVGKWIIKDDFSKKTAVFITFISMAFSGLVFGMVVSGEFRQTAVNLLGAIVSSAAVYFIMNSIELVSDIRNVTADRKALATAGIMYVLLTAVMCGLEIAFLNMGIILSCILLLCSCRFFGCYGGVICGVLTTVSVFIGAGSLASETVFFGAAGLIAGFVSKFTRITTATVFSGVVLLGQFVIGMNDYAFFVQSDIILASVVFMLIPEKLITGIGRICTSTVKSNSEYFSKELDFTVSSLADIRNNVTDIMTAFSRKNKSRDIIKSVSDNVCGRCRNKLECWEKNFENTNEAFRRLEKNSSTLLPVGFECICKSRVTDEFDRYRREAAETRMLSARISESQNALFAQMQASEEIVKSLSSKLCVTVSESMTKVLCRALERYDLQYSSAIVFATAENRIIAEIYMPEKTVPDMDDLCGILSDELSVQLEYSQPFYSGEELRIRFNQKTRYTIDAAQFQLSAVDGDKSGDTCGYFTDGLGFAYAFVSDGMGSGSRAAVDSQLTAKLFKKLIRLGLDCKCAIKMVNSIMLSKSGEESFATLDIAKINLETGGVTLYKSGASATLVKYGDSVMMFSFASNPVGIITDVKTAVKQCSFDEGDVLVMMSDGVPEKAYLYIKEQLVLDTPTDKLSENICCYSRKISPSEHPDDITAMSIKFVKNV